MVTFNYSTSGLKSQVFRDFRFFGDSRDFRGLEGREL